MAWSLVQSAGAQVASGTTASVAYASNVTLGNKLIAAVAVSGNPAEDGSTPGATTGSVGTATTLTVTSNSFSPPAKSMLVAIISNGHAAGTPSFTVTDTGSHSWTAGPAVNSGSNSSVAIYYTYLSTAPGSITVSAKNSTAQSQAMQLDVRVLNGAASNQAGAGSNTATGTSTSWTGSLTTTTVGSWVYVAVTGNAEEASITPNANTTTLNNFQASGGSSCLSGRGPSTGTTSPGATVFGWTEGGSSVAFAWAALEILPSVTCTQVQDGSGNLWTQLGAVADANNQTSLWALDVPPADAGTTPTLTATFNVSAGGSIVIEEVSGLLAGNTTAMADGTAATLAGSTQNPGSPTYTSTASNEYLVCVYGDSGTSVTTTQAAGWTLDGASRNSSANANCCVEYKNSTNGSETDGWTTSAASVWALVEVAFKLSAGGAASTFWTAAPPVYGPGLYQNPASMVAGLQPWRGDPSVTGFTTVGTGVISGTGVFAGQKDGAGTVKGITSGTGVVAPPVIPRVVNQWAGSYGQGVTFTSITSALQSCVVPLNGTSSVGGGTGTATAGNWLFVLASWTQVPAVAEVHIGVGDDVREWYREYPASSVSGNVRTSIAYCPNIGTFGSNLAPQFVYVAPDAEIAAITVLVVEVAGLGPWDTVGSGYPASNYAAAATSLTLAAGAPGSPSFIIAAAGGDSAAAGQAFAPSGWTTLRTVSQSNGSNQLASNVLTSAFLASSSSSQSVSASASPATDLSGFLLAVYTTGLNPVPGTQNPAWPYVKFEAAFGSGYNTPDSEMTWTDLTSRLWDWDEQTGIQFQLAQMQASNLTLELDDNDNYLAPLNSASPYYPNVLPGTPVRIRFAMGTIGGNTVNRWYVIQRNATQWDEAISTVFRRYCEVSGTDLWAALSVTPPTFYRSEIYEDAPYAWWPCDDQPGSSGVLPASLLNAAVGNTNVLNIAVNPSKGTVQPYYTTSGTSTVAAVNITNASGGQGEWENQTGNPPGMAIYQVGTNAGWMFGDPQSSTASIEASTGNPVSATPGSAAWQASGQAGNTGSNGWFLYCNDNNFPVLAGGITVEIWFNVGYYGSGTAWVVNTSNTSQTITEITTQPYNQPVTIWELATSTRPVCVLQLTAGLPGSGGHLNLITYNGATGTTHSIYTASDLRSNSWHMATVALTTTTWQVWLDGGANANVSGTATGMTSAWTWLIANGDLGSGGGNTSGTGLVHGANMSLSHIAVYPLQLPYYRVLDHYWAGVSAFGQLPAPQQVQVSMAAQEVPPFFASSSPTPAQTAQPQQNVYTADGSSLPSAGGYHAANGAGMSAVVVAATGTGAGAVTSGPSAWAVGSASYSQVYVIAYTVAETADFVDPFITWTGVAPQFYVYTGSSTASETQSAITAGDSEAFTGGYGGAASGKGVSHVSGGNGSTPPTAGSSIGDTVGQRIERLMRNGLTTSPNRCIDPAPLLVQAPGTAGGGIQAGAAVQAIQQSDGGMLFVDNLNNLSYWSRTHLASQFSSPVWKIGPSTGKYPYYPEIKWIDDPQRVWNVITIEPLSPTGASLPEITPTDSEAAQDSQDQYGPQPLQITSYLQSQTEMQNQANFLLTNYGTPQRRAENVKIDAAANPAMWPLVAGINVGDVVTLEDWQVGGGGTVYTMRVSALRRHFEFGSTADSQGDVVAAVWLTLDYEPSSYWS